MQDVKMTDSGRTVYGGGGITPDEKYTAPKPDRMQSEFLRKDAFFNFTAHLLRLARRETAAGLGHRQHHPRTISTTTC